MKYALLVYVDDDRGDAPDPDRPIHPAIATALRQPGVTGWARLHGPGSATSVSVDDGRTLLTDGPFVTSKEVVGGIILVEAANLDGALTIAADLQAARGDAGGGIEVRPVLEERIAGA